MPVWSTATPDFVGEIVRMGSAPPAPGMPAPSDAEKNLVMHVELPILGGHVLMGTDALESMGHTLTMPLTLMFRGAHFGPLVDKLGVLWMRSCHAEKK